MKRLLIASALLLPVVVFAVFKLSRAGYESAEYRVESRSGPFEIRAYPTLVLASTPMESLPPAEDGSFVRLFRYISGANEAQEKIAMTTPVLMTRDTGAGKMSFIAPRDLTEAGAPRANDREVRIETLQGGRFAAYRFSGSWDTERTAEATEKLLRWTRETGLETVGPTVVAGYDPPFTPPFLRRNEILIRLADPAPSAG